MPTSGQLPTLSDRIIGELPYREVINCIPYIDEPLACWPNKKIVITLSTGQKVRFQPKQFHAIQNPLCVHCGERGIKFLIVEPHKPQTNPNRNCQKAPKIMLVTQHNVLLTRDHIKPKCQGGSNHPDNIQVLCECCNNKKSVIDARPQLMRSYLKETT